MALDFKERSMTLREYFAGKPHGSKADMAKALGISRTWMALLISGLRVPSPELALEIERITNGEIKRVDLRPDLFGEVK
jgi:DNA-binding transcriptional regulator YdaS (Cro superfamily)